MVSHYKPAERQASITEMHTDSPPAFAAFVGFQMKSLIMKSI